MNAGKVEISAIIVSYNGRRFLPNCLSTLEDNLHLLSHEILLVDNGSTDDSVSFVQSSFPDVIVVENDSNLGFARAVNIGIKKASGEYLYILNQDLRFHAGATERLLARLKSDPQIGMIGPKYVGFDGKLQWSARAFPTYRHIIYEALLLSRLFPRHREFSSWRMGWFDHEHEMEVDQPMGSAMLIPRDVVDKVGSFDEKFPIFFNDVDYCRRMRDAGYVLLYFPDAVVEHFRGASTGRRPIGMKIESLFSMYRYIRKYARPREWPLLWLCGLLLLIGLGPLLLLTWADSHRANVAGRAPSGRG